MNIKSDKLKNLIDRLLNQSGKIRKNDTQICYFCPWCNHIKRKLEIAIDGIDFGSYHCWVCNQSGKSLKSLFFKLKVPKSYYEELYSIIGKTYYNNQFDKNTEEVHALPNEFKSLSIYSDSFEFGSAWYYLNKRGINRNDVIRYNIGYCNRGEYSNRIIIPSYDKEGNLNFFSARDYTEQSRFKYMLSPWSKNIIGFEVFLNWKEPITIVEGALDAIAVKNNVIPLFGTSMPYALKLAIIKNSVKRVNVVLDNDALRQAIDIFDHIEDLQTSKIDIHLVRLQDKDPSVLGFNKINEIIKKSKPLDFMELMKYKMEL